MKRSPIYSSTRKLGAKTLENSQGFGKSSPGIPGMKAAPITPELAIAQAKAVQVSADLVHAKPKRPSRILLTGQAMANAFAKPWISSLTIALLAAILSAFSVMYWAKLGPFAQPGKGISQEFLDAAFLKTWETQPLPSRQTLAVEKVRQAVVRVRALADLDNRTDEEKSASANEERRESRRQAGMPEPKARPQVEGDKEPDEAELSVGTGVLISDEGVILTNLHVVAPGKRWKVTFFDGFEAEATLVGLRPENDLAIIKVSKLPDDITPATLGGTGGLRPGDEVIAIGFPFGIGPSTSAGVVSGLNREFRSPDGDRLLRGLIQFDAAANPGNSGGPLINLQGEVVGIVTAIYNPTNSRTFLGIGFAVTMEAAGGALGLPPL